MDLRESFKIKFNKVTQNHVKHWVGNDKEKFDQLMKCFFDADEQIAWRAGWTASDIMLKHSDLAKPYLTKLVNTMKRPLQDGVRRNIFRVLQEVEIPEKMMSTTFQYAMQSISNPKDAVAIRCFALTTAMQICKKFPELIPELKQAINLYMMPDATPAIKSRIKRALKELQKNNVTSLQQ